MDFCVPHQTIAFEIPDAWLLAGNAIGFVPRTQAYVASGEVEWPMLLVPLGEVVAPIRNAGVIGLHEDRTVSLVRAIVSGLPVPAIVADEPPAPKQFRYRVRDGYHRFYISVALGFSHVPLSVRPYFDVSAF